MKKHILNIVICFLIGVSTCLAQGTSQKEKPSLVSANTNSPGECQSCECNFENLFSNWNKENIKNIDELELMDYKLVDTLSDSLKISEYYDKMTDYDNYYLRYDRDSKLVIVFQGHDIKGHESLNYLRKEIKKVLTLNNTVYVITAKLKNGKIIKDYVICDTDKKQITFDNMFWFINVGENKATM